MAATSVLSLHALAEAPRLDANLDGVINFPDLAAALDSGDFARVNQVLSHWGLHTIIPGEGGPGIPPPPGGQAGEKMPVARWVEPPFQTVSGMYRVRLVAEDITGILAVSFMANQSPSVFVTEPVWSDETAGYEYVALIDAADLGADARVEISAIVYPNAGPPRIMSGPVDSQSVRTGEHSMVVFGPSSQPVGMHVSRNGNDSTGDGTAANPFKSLDRAMGMLPNLPAHSELTVYLGAGSHPFGAARVTAPNDRWVTVRPAPGVSASSVKLVQGDSTRLGIPHVRLKGLTLDQRNAWVITGFSTIDDALWLDGVTCLGPGRWTYAGTTQSTPVFSSNIAAFYVTNTTASDYIDGFRNATLATNVTLRRLGSDAYSNSGLVLNCTVDDMDNGTHPFHPDVYQFSGTGSRDNTFVRGLTATNAQCQGVFSAGLSSVTNTYLGRIHIERNMPDPNVPPWSQWAIDSTNHLLIDGLALPDSAWSWRCPEMNNIQISGFDVFRQLVQTVGVWEEDWFID